MVHEALQSPLLTLRGHNVQHRLGTLPIERLQILQYSQGSFYINANPKIIDYWLQKCGGEGVTVDQSKICWTPHVTSDKWLR